MRGLAAGIAVLLALGGCTSRLDMPSVAWPGSGNEGTARLVEDRVWIGQDSDVAPGTLRAFLSDGTLVMTSCVEVYRLAPWRWVEGSTLVWEEDGATIRAEVALASRSELVLVLDLADGPVTRSYHAAQAPVVCPDLPR
jgi:hypothetical protein